MSRLNKAMVAGNSAFPSDVKIHHAAPEFPEKVVQFGEGNFLRAFADWMFSTLNSQGLFGGRVVVIQPIRDGLVEMLNRQNGLYTLILRGLKDGNPYEQREILSAISRGINPYTDWAECLKCAENPAIEFVVSNTTEAGIAYCPTDSLSDSPPSSYPGKLTAYLYRRFCHFNGDPTKGMTIIPCELIDRNGDQLKQVILRLAADWHLPEPFKQWIERDNVFTNTLVDRVVTGYPRDEIARLTEELGYEDSLIDTGELFHLWVIEGPAALAEKLPFEKAGLHVVWTDDMTPYRTRKVRILNGAHTASVAAAFLYGLDTVRDMMEHEIMGEFVRQVVYDEIIPSIQLDKTMLTEFAAAVVERFQNPFIKHYLLSIMLNSSSKFKTRVLPSIHEYYRQYGKLPERLVFALAALAAAYRGHVDHGVMRCVRGRQEYEIKDDPAVLEFFAELWRNFDGSRDAARRMMKKILGNVSIWGEDLNALPGLEEQTAEYVYRIANQGIRSVVADVTR